MFALRANFMVSKVAYCDLKRQKADSRGSRAGLSTTDLLTFFIFLHLDTFKNHFKVILKLIVLVLCF